MELNFLMLSHVNSNTKNKLSLAEPNFFTPLIITLQTNIIRCKEVAAIISGLKNDLLPIVRRKQVSTSAKI